MKISYYISKTIIYQYGIFIVYDNSTFYDKFLSLNIRFYNICFTIYLDFKPKLK